MRRSTFDKLASWLGLALAAIMLIAGGLLMWASNFANSQVADQLSAQKITMPSGKDIENPEIKPYLEKHAGQPMTTGDQAEAYANHFIQVHMNEASGGKTFNEVAGQVMGMQQNPNADKAQLAKLQGLKDTLFQGNTLRSMLLTAYAFGTIGKIAMIASIVAFVGGIVLLILALLGLRHARTAREEMI